MNLSKILSLTKVPHIISKPGITQRTNNLIAILGENDINEPPAFLESIRGNHTIQEDLKKKKTVSLYGRNDDIFKYCYLISDTLRNNQRSLSTGACVARSLLRSKSNNASLFFSNNFAPEQIANFLNGFCLGNYKFDRKGMQNNDNGKFSQLESLDIVHDKFSPNDEVSRFHIQSAQYSLFCREITNSRGNEADPESMLELCKEIANSNPNIKIEYIVGKELEEKGLNLIYQVGVGSPKPASLVCMKYEGNPSDPENVIALVGKGVCFDAGGLNLKPTGNIEDMFHDKGGACTVLAAFKGAVEMKLPVNIVCTMVYVENLMSAEAFKPKDIVRSYKGLTVEIGNTDAEGRLILADAMSYTQQVYKPKTLLEFSTLTGAVKVALGNEIAGIFSNDDGLASEIFKVGQETCEPVWRLPITDEHREDMRSNVADLNNKGRSISGGASKAAAFLENFVEKGVKWAHIDMAGTSFREGEKFVYSSGATGYGVKLLLNYLKKKGGKN